MFYDELKKREARLEEILGICKRKLKNSPEGRLRAIRCRDKLRYYVREEGSDPNGVYISKKNENLAYGLAEKEYLERLYSHAGEELKEIRRFLGCFPEDGLIGAYNDMNFKKKSLISPIEVDDETYAKNWEEKEYKKKEIKPEEVETQYFTQKGEQVRSKSEIIIADRLFALGIPYHYEEVLMLKGEWEVYPDFTILDKKKRRIVYLEHFGMMDSPEYLDSFFWKIHRYAESGIVLGHNLIATFEQSGQALNTRELDIMLKKVFEL